MSRHHLPAISLCLLLGGLLPAIWLANFTVEWFGAPDACDYAQMGHQINSGQGMSTLQILPRHLHYLHDQGLLDAESWPNLYRYPLPTVVNAAFELFTDDPVSAAIFQSGASNWLMVIIVFLLATRLTDMRVGTVAALLVATDPLLWRLSYTGMTESTASLLVVGTAYLTFANRSSGVLRAIALGGLCALAVLNRSVFLVLLPWAIVGYCFAALPGDRSIRRETPNRLLQVGLLLLAFLVVCSPWALRNWQITGSPLFSFSTTRNMLNGIVIGNFDRYLDAPYVLSEILNQYGSALVQKFSNNLWPNIIDPGFWWSRLGKYSLALPLVIAAIFSWDRTAAPSRGYRQFRKAGLVLWLGLFLAVSIAFHRHRFYVPLFPILAIILARELQALSSMALRRVEKSLSGVPISTIAVCALVLVFNSSARLSVSDPGLLGIPGPSAAGRMQELRAAVAPGSVVAAADSWNVALYAGIRALRMPIAPLDLLTIDSDYMRVEYVLIETDARRRVARARQRGTAELLASADFQRRYRLDRHLGDGSALYRRRAILESGFK